MTHSTPTHSHCGPTLVQDLCVLFRLGMSQQSPTPVSLSPVSLSPVSQPQPCADAHSTYVSGAQSAGGTWGRRNPHRAGKPPQRTSACPAVSAAAAAASALHPGSAGPAPSQLGREGEESWSRQGCLSRPACPSSLCMAVLCGWWFPSALLYQHTLI